MRWSIKVHTIEGFPGDRSFNINGTQVSTEIWYPRGKEASILYGYDITRHLELPESDSLRGDYGSSGLITKPKLLLDDSVHLQKLKKALLRGLCELKKKGLVEKNEDVVEHLLTCFLKYTKLILERDHDLDAQSKGKLPL